MRAYGARIKRYRALCSKHIAVSSSLVITSRWFVTSHLVAPVSVRLVYSGIGIRIEIGGIENGIGIEDSGIGIENRN